MRSNTIAEQDRNAVRESMRRLKTNPFVKYKNHIRGFVYDVETGALLEVSAL